MIPRDDFRFHHLGVAVADLHAAVPIYSTLFGYDCTSGPFDDPIQKVSVCFLTPSFQLIELIEGAPTPDR